MKSIAKLIVFMFFISIASTSDADVWHWKCVEAKDGAKRCDRVSNLDPSSSSSSVSLSFATCQLVCSGSGTVVPKPQNITVGASVAYFLPSRITRTVDSCQEPVCSLLDHAFDIMIATIDKYHPKSDKQSKAVLWASPAGAAPLGHGVSVRLSVSGAEDRLVLSTDESYSMRISTEAATTTVTISAPTFFGARHALETLSQLIDYDRDRNALQIISEASVDDRPAFPYRGVIVDTARNYLPVDSLKGVIDGMSYNKLNYFHWHITDTQSFPLKLASLPKMALYGAYAPEKVYTAEDVKSVVEYAKVRGVRVIPELDAPAHMGHGWQWGPQENLGDLVVCLDAQPWTSYCVGPPCGQLNLANPSIYEVLEKIYTEIVDMFGPLDFFHYGGDEININCWNSSQQIRDWMTTNGFGLDEHFYYNEWGKFQEKTRQLVTKANNWNEVPGIIWTSELTKKERVRHYMSNKQYIIQIWTTGTDPVIRDMLQLGYKVIFSNYDALYMDCGVSSWVADGSNWCSPYKGWQKVYDNDIKAIARNLTGTKEHDDQVLGGEMAAWSEQIDEHNLEAKLWPRGAALAERLWTDPDGDYRSAENRILNHRQRLSRRGLRPERLQPEWCLKNEGECRIG